MASDAVFRIAINKAAGEEKNKNRAAGNIK